MISKNVLLVGLLVGIILISGCIANKQELSTGKDCYVKVPNTIHIYSKDCINVCPEGKLCAAVCEPVPTMGGISPDADYNELHIPRNLCITSYPSDISGYYIVQFKGPVYEDYKSQIRSQGGTIYDYVPENAFIVKLNENAKNNIQNLEFIQWVGIYQPAYKFQPYLFNETGDITLNVLIFSDESATDIENRIKSFGGEVQTVADDKIRVRIDSSKIPDIANILGVRVIEKYSMPRID